MSTLLIGTAVGILVLLIILLCLFGLLAIQRIRTERRNNLVNSYIESTEELWYAYLIEGTIPIERLAPSNQIEIEAADQVLYRYRNNFNSDDLAVRVIQYAELYLASHYKKLLTSKTWSVRMNGLQRIALFNLHFMMKDIQAMALKGSTYSKEEVLLIYKNIALLTPDAFMPYYIKPAIPLGEFDYRRLLTYLNIDQLIQLSYQFEKLPTVMQYTIVDVTGSGHFLRLLPLLDFCLTSEDAELRIRALKAMSRIDAFPNSTLTDDMVHSDDWEERLMVAKLYANAPIEDAKHTLTALLTDSVYKVRKQAAASLQEIRTGDSALKEFIRQSDDTYAVDMAIEMIGKE